MRLGSFFSAQLGNIGQEFSNNPNSKEADDNEEYQVADTI
jgi:hypothetical protein